MTLQRARRARKPVEEWPADLPPAPRPTTTPVSLRVDSEVLRWFRGKGRGYQSRINAVLRAYVARQRQSQRTT